jgi:hypothetical protein
LDTFKFSNPGTLLVSLRQYYEGGISECRNPNIQKMFLMIGSAEKAGSGVNKIFAGWEYAHWRNPFLRTLSQPDRIVLELPMSSILPEKTLKELHGLFGEQIDTLGKDELTILATCHIEGEVSNSRLQFMLKAHRYDITKILQELCKQGYLFSDNRGRWTVYHLNTEYQKTNQLSANAGLATPDANLATPDANLATPDANLATPEIDLSNTKTNKKLKKNELEELILYYCKDDFYTLEQIAVNVERNISYLKDDVIKSLVRSGRLLRLHPDKPNHPNQAYKSSSETD